MRISESLDDKALDELLSKFYCEICSSDGELYNKSSTMTLRHGINRHLSNSRKSPVDIVNDSNFNQSQRMFSAVYPLPFRFIPEGGIL